VDGAELLAALSGTKPVRPTADGQANPPAPARRKEIRLVLTILVRDEVDVIETTIDYHLAQGVDTIIATDNRSRDGTRQILGRYAKFGAGHTHPGGRRRLPARRLGDPHGADRLH
jgi:hypothetical protein